jgi:hypothetical protein
VDADDGQGNPLNVHRTVAELIAAEAAGCFLEDQVWPKRCGHMHYRILTDQGIRLEPPLRRENILNSYVGNLKQIQNPRVPIEDEALHLSWVCLWRDSGARSLDRRPGSAAGEVPVAAAMTPPARLLEPPKTATKPRPAT